MSLVLELDDVKGSGDEELQGKTNPAFINQEADIETEMYTRPLTYAEFYPKCLNAEDKDEIPTFEKLSKVIEQANQYLKGNQNYELLKCETAEKKVQQGPNGITIDVDSSVHHEASNGTNNFVRGLRLWMKPKEDDTLPVQQIGFTTIFPDRQDNKTNTDFFSAIFSRMMKAGTTALDFAPLSKTMEKLNRQLQMRPLPGKVLNVETVNFRFSEDFSSEGMDAETCFWQEFGTKLKVNIFALRVYYVIGEHAFESLAFKDFAPHKIEPSGGASFMSPGKFTPFHKCMKKAATWLQEQKGIKVVNVQTVNVKNESVAKVGPPTKFSSDICGYVEQSGSENQLVRVLRIYYLSMPQSEASNHSYADTNMQCRLFVPERPGKTYESFSTTLQKVARWLHRSGNCVFNIETLDFLFNTESYGTGVTDDKPDTIIHRNHGRYFVTAVRFMMEEAEENHDDHLPALQTVLHIAQHTGIYFPGPITEAPPEIKDETEEGYWCSIQ